MPLSERKIDCWIKVLEKCRVKELPCASFYVSSFAELTKYSQYSYKRYQVVIYNR